MTGRPERDLVVTAADGVRLLVDHHPPRPRRGTDAAVVGGVVVWIRTPYGRRGMNSVVRRFTRCGAHVLVEALRGTDGSGGRFDGITVHPEDGRDVADWLRARTWYPGRFATWGISFLGTAGWALAGDELSGWELAMLHDTQAEAHRTMFPGGVFASVMLGLVTTRARMQRRPRESAARALLAEIRMARRVPDALATLPLRRVDERLVGAPVSFFREWLDHAEEPADSAYWAAHDLRANAPRMPDHVHLVSGWYDVALASTLHDHAALRAAGKSVQLVIGSWYHGQGMIDRALTAEVDGVVSALAGGDASATSSVRVHVGGAGPTGRGEWRDLARWPPPAEVVVHHLQPGGGLTTAAASASAAPDRFRYDPTAPTPSVGGAQENFAGNAGARDNRRLEARDDVLTYTSEPLSEDREIVGPVSARIAIRSTLEHTDVFVRLCDVDARGRSVNLCDGIRRLRPGDPPADDDGVVLVPVDLVATAHRVRRGHRIRVQVSGGAHPRLVGHHGTGEPMATATTVRVADQEVFAHRSEIALPVIPTPTTPTWG